MNGFLRIDRHGVCRIHFHSVSRFDPARAGINVLCQDPIVLHPKRANRRRHPTILITMIMNRTRLSNLPADGDQFIETVLVDQVPSVVLTVPEEIWRKTFRVDWVFAEKALHSIDMLEAGSRQLPEFGSEILYRQ